MATAVSIRRPCGSTSRALPPGSTPLVRDVRYGVRLIRKAPVFSAIAIVSLTVGIGASTVLFSFANSFLFRPIHAANPGELVELFTSDFDGPLYGGSSYADYEAFAALPVFRDLLASKRAGGPVHTRSSSWATTCGGAASARILQSSVE